MECIGDYLRLVSGSEKAYRMQIWDSGKAESFRIAVPNTLVLDSISISNAKTAVDVKYTIITPSTNPFPLNGKTKVTVDEKYTGVLIALERDYVVLAMETKAMRIQNYHTITSEVKLDPRYVYLHIHDAKAPISLSYTLPNLSWEGHYIVTLRENVFDLRYVGRLKNDTGFSFTPSTLVLETRDGSVFQLSKPMIESFGTIFCPILFSFRDLSYQRICRYLLGGVPQSCLRFNLNIDLPAGNVTVYDREEADQHLTEQKFTNTRANEDTDLVLGPLTTIRATSVIDRKTETKLVEEKPVTVETVKFEAELTNESDENVILVVRLDIGEKVILLCDAKRYKKNGSFIEFFLNLEAKSGPAVFTGSVELI